MSIELPHWCQEKDSTCALACLRMVLAYYATIVEEGELEAQAVLEERGTLITELVRLASAWKLQVENREVAFKDLEQLLAAGKIPIAYIDRAVFDLTPRQRRGRPLRAAAIHNVIPTKFGKGIVTLNDPLHNAPTRRSVRLFREAYERLGSVSVVCWKEDQ